MQILCLGYVALGSQFPLGKLTSHFFNDVKCTYATYKLNTHNTHTEKKGTDTHVQP